MKVIIYGATGTVGKYLVKQAIFKDHQVKAFGRNIHKINFSHDNLQTIAGAVFDEHQVYHAIKGCDAVVSALGGAFDGTDRTRSLGIKTIISQMKKAGVKRIIALGNMGVLSTPEGGFIVEGPDYPPQFLPVGEEHLQAYKYLADSDLDWTYVCSPDIIDEGPTGSYVTKANFPPKSGKMSIHAGDLALFMITELEKNQFVGMRVGISN